MTVYIVVERCGGYDGGYDSRYDEIEVVKVFTNLQTAENWIAIRKWPGDYRIYEHDVE